MSTEQPQSQRPKSSSASRKSTSSRKSGEQQRGHQLSDDGPAPTPAAATTGATSEAYQPLSDDQPEGTSSDNEKPDGSKPKKENPLKKFIASLKNLSCTGGGAGVPKSPKGGSAQGADEDENDTPNARPVSQSSLESKNQTKVGEKGGAPQIDVSAVDGRRSVDGRGKEGEDGNNKNDNTEEKKDGEDGEEKKVDGEKEKVPLTTTVISATPPTL